jgi:hypothetical protein
MNSLNLFTSFAPKGNDNKAKGQNAVIYTRVSSASQ